MEQIIKQNMFSRTLFNLVLVVSLTTMNLDEFAKCLLARFKPVAFYRFDDKEFEKYKQVVFIGQKRVSIEKWKGEIERQIPYAKATIITDFSQLLELRKRGSLRVGKEFYILSKDFAKLSYSLKPVPKKEIAKMAYMKKCRNPDCGVENMPVRKCVSCGGKDFEKGTTKIETIYGMKCPYCGEVLAAYTASGGICGLTANDFAYKTGRNSNCIWCGESLWMPHVKNIGAKKISPWYRATYFRNKAQKGKTTVWVHKEYARKYYAVIVACGCMDEYHLRFGSEVYHICELAERLERCQATCAPEPEITEDECAWKLGNKGYLYVQVSEGGYDYQLYHSDFSEWDGGQVDTDGTMNEAKRMILEMYEMDTQTHERISTDELENSVEEKGEIYE